MVKLKDEEICTKIAVDNILRLMSRDELTYAKVAEDCGFGPHYLYYLKTHASTMTLGRAYTLAKYFNITLDELITEHGTDEEIISDIPELTQQLFLNLINNVGVSIASAADRLSIDFDVAWGLAKRYGRKDDHEHDVYKGLSGKPPVVSFKVTEGPKLSEDAIQYIRTEALSGTPIGVIGRNLGVKFPYVYGIAQRAIAVRDKEK